MKKNILLLIISIIILSCTEKKNDKLIEHEISKQLERNENVDKVFLDFKFGMDKVEN